MNQRAGKVEVTIEELKDSWPSDDGSGVVLDTEALVDGQRHDTQVEVQQEDLSAVAVALLNPDASAGPADAALAPAMRCLGAGVVHHVDPGSVRVHLQFDSGQVLPVEMSTDAALVLCRGLFVQTGAASGFDPVQWGVASGPMTKK